MSQDKYVPFDHQQIHTTGHICPLRPLKVKTKLNTFAYKKINVIILISIKKDASDEFSNNKRRM
jgi:hypothetical protein